MDPLTRLKSVNPIPRIWRRLPRAQAFALLAALAWMAAPPAFAERADRDKPIQMEADQATVDDANQISVFTGNVTLIQGTLMIRADKMIVKRDAEGYQYGTAFGNPAAFREKREGENEYIEGWGERLEYDSKTDRVQFFKQARLKRGQDEVRGNYISYDGATEFFQVIGGGKEAATESNPRGRVRAVIQPKSKIPETRSAPPVSIKPAETIANPRPE